TQVGNLLKDLGDGIERHRAILQVDQCDVTEGCNNRLFHDRIPLYFNRSDISYSPAGCFARNTAALIEPLAKISFDCAEWERVMTSCGPAKITSCSPTMVPPRTECIPISFLSRFLRW